MSTVAFKSASRCTRSPPPPPAQARTQTAGRRCFMALCASGCMCSCTMSAAAQPRFLAFQHLMESEGSHVTAACARPCRAFGAWRAALMQPTRTIRLSGLGRQRLSRKKLQRNIEQRCSWARRRRALMCHMSRREKRERDRWDGARWAAKSGTGDGEGRDVPPVLCFTLVRTAASSMSLAFSTVYST